MSTFQRLNSLVTFDNTKHTEEQILSSYRKFMSDKFDEFQIIGSGSRDNITVVVIEAELSCSYKLVNDFTSIKFIEELKESIDALQVRSRTYCLDYFEWDDEDCTSSDYDEDEYLFG